MNDQPTIEVRPALVYVARGVVVPMRAFADLIPRLIEDVSVKLSGSGVKPSGPPLMRYRLIDMPDRMDVEIGLPVVEPPGEIDLLSGVLPAGRYATLTYAGVKNAVAANKRLIEWTHAQGEAMACQASWFGDVFEGRYESFIEESPDPSHPEGGLTQIWIKLRD